MRRILAVVWLACFCAQATVSQLSAEDNESIGGDSEEALIDDTRQLDVSVDVHDELRLVREEFLEAIESADIEKILSYCDEDVVVVWQDGAISRRHDGVGQYWEEKRTGADATIKRFSMQWEIAEQSLLPDENTAIAFGAGNSHYETKSSGALDVAGAWTATLIRKDDRWKFASLHMSAGLYDNPLVERAESTAMWGGVIAGAFGAAVGALATRWLAIRRRKKR